MGSKVFISHKDSDSSLARRVASRVRSNGLSTYLDSVDDALIKDGPELADHLLRRMAECQQLIAVVSNQTKGSWWVPWEIGVGSEKGFRMASYSEFSVDLPSYLEKWPSLHSDHHIDLYCQYSKITESSLDSRTRGIYNEERIQQATKDEAQDFHRLLKNALRAR